MTSPALLSFRPARPTWLTPRVLRVEAVSGLVVALALIPEAIAFSIIAGVDPRVGLFASFTMAVTIAFVGGRPAMISAATGAIALVVAPLAREHGVEYLVAAVVLGGVLQVLFAVVGVARLMRFLPRSVMVGFVNALAILIFTSQLPYLAGVPWEVYALLAIAMVGLIESLMTAKLVDDITDTRSDKTRESWGQGVANIVTGFFGGMGGCAMIGQTMINVKYGGARTRASTFLAGVFLLVLVVALGQVVALIPMAALVGVMIMVAVGTFDWHSVAPATLRRMPLSETAVMVSTVAVTVATHNLAYGVGVGVLVAMVLFARRVAHLVEVTGVLDPDGTTKVYRVTGQLFFASSNDLVFAFDYADDPDNVILDLSDAHVWDASTVAALDAVTTKYEARGTTVTITGMNTNSRARHERLAGQLTSAH